MRSRRNIRPARRTSPRTPRASGVTLSGIGVKEAHIEILADLAFADFAHPNNPKPVSREDFKLLYTKAL